ncbi:MAG: amidohydrolase family protein [Chitinophagales bacterium]|nr:amidohydrolase family protein [Chitinophagales bacterium]
MSAKILIKNGLLFDGDENKKAVIKNILIEKNIIKKISSEEIAVDESTQVIDASNQWITPSFIDTHTHYDAEIIASPGLKESARHGVTTVIMGSCSVSAIYNNPEDTSDTFTRVEAIPREVMLPLLEKVKTWNSPKTWINYINNLPLGVNVASFVGHSDLRSKVMGLERSVSHKEKATKAEEEQMNTMLNEALEEGFLGLSTMDNPWDKMDGNRYWSRKTPSFYASWKERKNMIKTLRKRNAILQGAPNLVTRYNAVQYMMKSSGVFRKPLKTTMIALVDLIGDRYIYPLTKFGATTFNSVFNANFRMQSPPVPFTVYYNGVDSVMFEEFPSGEAIRDLAKNLHERDELISDKAFRENFKKEIKNKFAPKVWHKDLSLTTILECPDKTLVGKNFYEVAVAKNQHPVDCFLDMIIEYDKKIRWTTTIGNDRPEKYKDLYNYKYNIISFSDAGAHLTNMAFYDFPIQMIKQVQDSIDKNKPIMTMEKCIWRLSKEQADWFGVDACYIAEGKVADINIINPQYLKDVKDEVETAPIEEFNDFERLVNRNKNLMSYVIVGGKIIFEQDNFVEGYGKSFKTGRFLKYQNLN